MTRLRVEYTDGRAQEIRLLPYDGIVAEREGVSSGEREGSLRLLWHACRRTDPSTPEDFDAWAQTVATTEKVDADVDPTRPAGSGGS